MISLVRLCGYEPYAHYLMFASLAKRAPLICVARPRCWKGAFERYERSGHYKAHVDGVFYTQRQCRARFKHGYPGILLTEKDRDGLPRRRPSTENPKTHGPTYQRGDMTSLLRKCRREQVGTNLRRAVRDSMYDDNFDEHVAPQDQLAFEVLVRKYS